MDDIRHAIPAGSNRFTDQVRQDLRDRGYAYQTEKTYLHWIRRFILFHGKRHPQQMGAVHINQFLSHLGSRRNCSPATLRIALNALIYLYHKFLRPSGSTGPQTESQSHPLPWRSRAESPLARARDASQTRERHQVYRQRRSPHTRRAPCRHDLGSATQASIQYRHRSLQSLRWFCQGHRQH